LLLFDTGPGIVAGLGIPAFVVLGNVGDEGEIDAPTFLLSSDVDVPTFVPPAACVPGTVLLGLRLLTAVPIVGVLARRVDFVHLLSTHLMVDPSPCLHQ
jgi:hypothetical protein